VKAKFAPACVRNSLLSYYLFIIAKLFKIKDGCLKFVYIAKNRRFTAFLDSKIHTRLAIVTANELAFAFPPRNLPKTFRPDPSTFYLVIVVTDKQTNKQTDRQTYAGDSIIPAKRSFRGDNKLEVDGKSVGKCLRGEHPCAQTDGQGENIVFKRPTAHATPKF